MRLLPLGQTSAVFFMILRLKPHYKFCTSILNLGCYVVIANMILISNQPVRLWTVTSHSVMKRKGKRLLILKMLFQYLKNGKRYVIPCCLFCRKIQLIMSCRSNRRILLNVSTALAVFLVSPKWTAGLLEGLRKSSVAMAILGFAAVMRPRLPSLIRSESGTP